LRTVKDGLKNSLGSDFVRLDRRVCRLKKWKLNFRWERKLYQNRSRAGRETGLAKSEG